MQTTSCIGQIMPTDSIVEWIYMEWYEAEVKQLEAANAARGLVRCATAFYGSSTIRLWTSLGEELRDASAINLGFGGSTLEACAYFFERLVVPVRPRSLVVYAGDNDLGDGKSPEMVVGYFRNLAGKVEEAMPDIPFSFISIKPSPARLGIVDRIRRVNEAVRAEMTGREGRFFIDVFGPMLSAGGGPRPELFGEDGLHLGPAGYQVWTEVLEPYRNRIFNLQCPECNSAHLCSGEGASRIP